MVMDGNSQLKIDAPYVTAEGLYFRRGTKVGGTVIAFNSNNGIVRNSAVIDDNPLNLETKGCFVFFAGDNNLVDRCYFKGKSNDNPTVGNGREGSRHNSVTTSYFKDIPYDPQNGREDFRIWGFELMTGHGDDGAFFTIEGNLFDHADGEGGVVNFAPATSGFTVKQLPLGWTEAQEVAKYKPLTPSDVGPDWVRNKGL